MANLVSTCSESHEDSKIVKISWRSHRSWLRNYREVRNLIAPCATIRSHHPSFGHKTFDVHLCWPGRHDELARAAFLWPEHGEPSMSWGERREERERREREKSCMGREKRRLEGKRVSPELGHVSSFGWPAFLYFYFFFNFTVLSPNVIKSHYGPILNV